MHNLIIKANIDNGIKAYNILAELSQELEKRKGDTLVIDFANVTFIAANQLAVLGALFEDFCRNEEARIILMNLSDKVKRVMQKNGFSTLFGLEKRTDYYHTTIPHKSFMIDQIDEFEKYLLLHIFQREDIPNMTIEAQNAIIDNMLEIFNNVKEHTSAINIYSCGQFFPQSAALYFTIADIGETIKYNVNAYNLDIEKDYNRIEWAMQEGNSTRKNGAPGGLGFSVLNKFIKYNKGKLAVVSDDECYEYNGKKERYMKLETPFRGTIVTVAINMNDNFTYLAMGNEIEQILF